LLTLAGVIGSGKSSMTKILSNELGTKPFYEPVKNNPILPLFYNGNKMVEEGKWKTNPYAFELQIYFLNNRFNMIKKAVQEDNNVLDRSIYEDAIFMKMNVDQGHATKDEWDVYSNLLNNMMEEYPHFSPYKKAPDLMVMIDVNYDTMIKRIKKRGRKFEQIDQDSSLVNYYKDLIDRYAHWKHTYQASPLLVIDGNKYDFMESNQDRNDVLDQIEDAMVVNGTLTKEEAQKLHEKRTNK
jgi:deoxyadenosine/deoxycytidine kinase